MTEYITLPKQAIDLTGQRFGRLTALGPVGRSGNGRIAWSCRCDCGKTTTVSGKNLRNGNTQSCGCLQRERISSAEKIHGMSHSKIHQVWLGIKQRCDNPNHGAYKNYGGRGIKICDEWHNSFEAFIAYVASLPHYGEKGYTLDRINNSIGYQVGNIRYATRIEQNRNSRHVRPLTFDGRTQCLQAWADEMGVGRNTLTRRLRNGWSVEDALSKPGKPRAKK